MGKYSLILIASLISALALTPTCYAVTYQARKDFFSTFIVTVPATSTFAAPFTMTASTSDTLSVNTPIPFAGGTTNLTSSLGTATVNVTGSGTSSIFVTSGTTVTRSVSASAILASMSGGTLTVANNGLITFSGGTVIGSAVTGNVTVNISNTNSIVGNVNLSGGSGSVGGTITQTGSGTINGNLTFGKSTYQLNLFGSGNVTGAIAGNTTSATILYSSGSPITLPGAITNMHNISALGAVLTLNGTTELSNNLTVNSGSLSLGNTISGAAVTSNSGTINNNAINAFALTGVLTNNAGSNFNINSSLTRANTTNHSGTITIASGQTFTNTGVFYYVSSGSGVITGAGNFTNNAFLNFDSSSPSANAMAFTGTFTNTSNFNLSRSLTRAGPTINTGAMDIGPGRTFTNTSNNFTQSAGSIYDSGTFVNQNVFNMNGGIITSAFDNQYVVNVNSSFTTNASFTNSLSTSTMNVFINFIPGVAFTHNGIMNVQNTATAKFTAPTSFVSTGTINVNGTGSVAGALVGGANSVLNIGYSNSQGVEVNILTTSASLTVNSVRTIALITNGSQLNVASGFGISGLNTQFTVGVGTTASLSAVVSGTATTTNNGTISNNATDAFALTGKLTNNAGSNFNVVNASLTRSNATDHSGTMTITSPQTFTNNTGAVFDYVSGGSGAVIGTGALSNSGTINFNSSTSGATGLSFTGTFTNSSAGTLNVNQNLTRPNPTTNNGLILIASGKTFTNSGTMTVSTTTGKIKDITTNGNFTNFGTLIFNTVTPATDALGFTGTFTNTGTLTVNENLTRANATTFNGTSIAIAASKTFTNSGTFTHTSGAISGAGTMINTGTYNYNGGSITSKFSNSSTMNINASLSLSGSSSNSGSMLIDTGFTLTNHGTMTISTNTGKIKNKNSGSNFTNSGTLIFNTVTPATDALGFTGTFTNTGTLTVNENLTRANATTFNGTSIAIAAGKTFTNSGVFTHTSGAVSGAGTLVNNSTGTYDYNNGSISSLLNNQGVMNVNAALSLTANSNNSGTINIATGITLTNSAVMSVTTSTGKIKDKTVTGNFTNSGTLTFDTVTPATDALGFTGTFLNTGTLAVNQNLTRANATTLSGSGAITIASGMSLTTSGTFTHTAGTVSGAGTLINSGTYGFNAGGITSIVSNTSTGTMNIAATFVPATNSANDGIFNINSGGAFTIPTVFTFSKTININNGGTMTGALDGSGGATSTLNIGVTSAKILATSATLSITGVKTIALVTSGSQLTVASTFPITALDTQFTIGAGSTATLNDFLAGTAATTLTGGSGTTAGGIINNSLANAFSLTGSVTVGYGTGTTPQATINVIQDMTISGAISLSGSIVISNGKTFTNSGTLTVANSNAIISSAGNYTNAGTLTFSTAPGASVLGFTGLFTNAGTLTVNQNIIRANATTHTGSISIAASRTFTNNGVFTQDNINSSTSTVSGSGIFSNTNIYDFKAGSFTSILNNSGTMNVGGYTETATLIPAATSTSSSALNIKSLGLMTLNSSFGGVGTVTVESGGTLTIATGGVLVGASRTFNNNGSLNLAEAINLASFTSFSNTGGFIFVTKSGTPITGNIPTGGSNLTIGQDSTGNTTATTFATGGTINIASISVIGASTFTANHAISGVNNGLNIASSSGAATFNSGSTYSGTGFVNNNGSLTIKTASFTAPIQNMAGATLVLNGATTTSSINNPPSANFNVTGVSANTGNITNSGIMNLTAAFTNTGTTTSDGTLTVAAAFTNSGGNIINNNIMTVTAAMPGSGTIVNNKTLNINAAVTIANPINNTANGTVTINSAATINGITGNAGIVRILTNISSNDPIVNNNQMTIAGNINFISGAFSSNDRNNIVTVSGSRTITGAYANAGTSNFTITNEATYDKLNITGGINLDHGIINVASTFGGQGNINQTYNFPIFTGTINGGDEPDTINLPTSTLLSTWSSSTTAGGITISYVRSSYLSHALGATNYALAQIIEQISAGTPNAAQVVLINAINSATTTAQFNANLGLLVPNFNATAPLTTLITTQSTIFNKIETRIAAVRDDRNPAMTTGFTAGDLNPDTAVWMGTFGSLATKRVNDSNPGYKARTTGVLLGIDTREFTKDVLGVAIGFSNSRVSESSNQNFNTAIHGYHGMIYGTHPFKDSQFFDYLATGSFNKSSGTRRIVIGGTNLTPFATFTGYQAGLRFNYGKSYNFGDYFKITPLGSFQYTFLHQPNYSETGGAAALNISGKPNRNIATIGFGSKVGFDNDDWWLVGSRELRAMVTYDVANARRVTTANFVAGGPAFSFLECPARFALKLGIDMVFDIMKHLHIQINYDFELRHKYTDHTAMMKLRYLF